MDFLLKNKILFWIIGILVVLNLVTIGTLWFWKCRVPPPPHIEKEHSRKDGKMFLNKELDLSKQQADEFDKLREEHFKEMQKIQDEIRKLKDELFTLLPANDTVKAADITNKIGLKHSELEILIFKHFLKLRGICSDTQKSKFDIVIKDIVKPKGPLPEMRHKRNPDLPPDGAPPPGPPGH